MILHRPIRVTLPVLTAPGRDGHALALPAALRPISGGDLVDERNAVEKDRHPPAYGRTGEEPRPAGRRDQLCLSRHQHRHEQEAPISGQRRSRSTWHLTELVVYC